MKLINESMYWHGTGGISNCLNRLLYEGLCCAPAVIVTIFFCEVKITPLLEELPNNIIPYFITMAYPGIFFFGGGFNKFS